MLLEFALSNYKCFKEEIVFSMIPNNRIQDLEYSILKKDLENGKSVRALSSAVVYGPNASGKTNLIGAMEVIKAIIKRGNIENELGEDTPNIAKNRLEFIPNYMSEKDEPTIFRIKFICNNEIVEYMLSVVIGNFLVPNQKRYIKEERLYVNEKLIFERELNKCHIENLSTISEYLPNKITGKNELQMLELAESNISSKDLFLCSQFKVLYSKNLVKLIQNWFEDKFKVIYSCNRMSTRPVAKSDDDEIIFDEAISNAIKEFGLLGNRVIFRKDKKTEKIEPVSLIETYIEEGHSRGIIAESDFVESYGTIRLMDLFPILLDGFAEGKTIVIDEFDASIHPMALMNIINIFHDEDINKNNAQLIFNTHNPIFLSKNLFRRDEIKFMDVDEYTKLVEHYSLSDFGTQGSEGVRKEENYLDKYFVSKYGAIKDVDFSDIFLKAVEEGDINGTEK